MYSIDLGSWVLFVVCPCLAQNTQVKTKANNQEKLIGKVERQTNIGNNGYSRHNLTKGRVELGECEFKRTGKMVARSGHLPTLEGQGDWEPKR